MIFKLTLSSFFLMAMALLVVTTTKTTQAAAGDDHDHDHISCACAADEWGFTINCADTNAMLVALQTLRDENCAFDCTSDPVCIQNYYIVQAHHDYCPEAGLPSDIEDDFHDYDQVCKACDIGRQVTDVQAPDCPVVSCSDGSGEDAYQSLLDANCLLDCDNTAICRDMFFVLRAVHDTCPHDTLSRRAEEGIHDLEVPCMNHVCNVVGGNAADESLLVCSDANPKMMVSSTSILVLVVTMLLCTAFGG
jgi:hypothetical protein